MKGTPASLAKPAARKAAAMIPCNVQAPMRRVGRTDWMEAALILVSVACEVESEENLRRRPSWQQPIYSDDIHRFLRYVADAAPPPGVMNVFRKGCAREIRRWRDGAKCSRLFGRDPP